MCLASVVILFLATATNKQIMHIASIIILFLATTLSTVKSATFPDQSFVTHYA